MAIAPGTFTSRFDTGLPINPQTQDPPDLRDDLQSAYNAIQVLQMQMELLLARLQAAGIP